MTVRQVLDLSFFIEVLSVPVDDPGLIKSAATQSRPYREHAAIVILHHRNDNSM